MYQFDPRNHRYRNLDTGRFVRYAEVLQFVDGEVKRLEVRLQGHARLLNSGKINVGEFQLRFAESLKNSHLRMAALGAGGQQQMTAQQLGHVGRELRTQYEYLYYFGYQIESGKVSEKRILQRSKMYAKSINTSFYQAEFTARGKVGFYAKRLLDPQAQHCESCFAYQQLNWVPINQIVPPGVRCICGGRCRCRVIARKI